MNPALILAWLNTPMPPRPRRRWVILWTVALNTAGGYFRMQRARDVEKRLTALEEASKERKLRMEDWGATK